MPKVEQAGPSGVQTQITRGARARDIPVPDIGGVLQGVADVGKGVAAISARMDTTAAEEAMTGFEREKNDMFFNPDTGYFNTQGRNAFDGAKGTTDALVKLQEKYRDSLTTGSAKELFSRTANAHLTRANADIQRHSAKGFQAWEVATLGAQTENSLENAALYWNDPKRLKVQGALGEQAILDAAELQGIGTEATNERLQTYRSAFATNTIESAIVSSSAEGQTALDAAVEGNLLEGPDKVKLEKAIEAKAKTEKTQADAQMSVITATRLNDQHDSRSDIVDEVNKIEDPVLRKKTMSESMYQFNQNKVAKTEAQAEFYNTGIDHLTGGGSPESFQAQNPAAWEGMSSVQRNNLVNGKHMTTDQVQFNNLLSMPNSQLAQENAADYAGVFKPADVSKLRTAIDRARKGHANSTVQSLSVKTNAIAEQFFGKKATWKNKTKAPKVQALMNAVQSVVEDAEDLKGGKLSPTEIDDVLATFTRQITIERSFAGIDLLSPDDDIDVSNTPPSQVAELNRFINAEGEDSYQLVINELNRNNIPVNVDTILTTYRQATQ